MKVVVTWGQRNANAVFILKAQSIAGAVKLLDARDEWGRFDGHIHYKRRGDGRGIVLEVTLTPSFTITMPKWPGYRSQQQDIKENWNAMCRALREHEDEHRQLFEQGVRKLVNDLEARGVIKGGELEALMRSSRKSLQAQHDDYDTKTDHGKLRGVALKIPNSH